MNHLLSATILLFAVWPVYYLLLRYSDRYVLNRLFLLLVMVAVVTLPFIEFSSPAPVVTQSIQGSISYLELGVNTGGASIDPIPKEIRYDAEGEEIYIANQTGVTFFFLPKMYFFGLGLMIIVLGFRLLFILALHLRSRLNQDGSYRLLHRKAKHGQAFTFGRNLYFSSDVPNSPDFDHILNHERVHARQLHSLDILLSELFLCIFWFHPAAWWLRTSMRANLEYLVDQAVISNGADRRDYQLALVRQSQGAYGLALALPFSEPSLKSRIQRMTNMNRYRLISLVAAAVLTLWMGGAVLLVNGEPSVNTQQTVIESMTLSQYEKLFGSVTNPHHAGIKSFELYFRRLPTPNEHAQIQEILASIGNTQLSIYHPCGTDDGYYALQLSHWLNAEAQLPLYLQEGDLMTYHNVFKLVPNGIGGGVPKVPHVAAGYFTPVTQATVWDKNDLYSWHGRRDKDNQSGDSVSAMQEEVEEEGPMYLSDFRANFVDEEIVVLVNGERWQLRDEPSIKINADAFSIVDGKIEVKQKDAPVITWNKNFYFSWKEVEAKIGPLKVPANVRMYCLLGMSKNRFGLIRNVSYGYTGSVRDWVEGSNIPDGRDLKFYLNDDLITASSLLAREFSKVDVQFGYNSLDPDGPVVVQVIDDVYE